MVKKQVEPWYRHRRQCDEGSLWTPPSKSSVYIGFLIFQTSNSLGKKKIEHLALTDHLHFLVENLKRFKSKLLAIILKMTGEKASSKFEHDDDDNLDKSHLDIPTPGPVLEVFPTTHPAVRLPLNLIDVFLIRITKAKKIEKDGGSPFRHI